MDLERFEKLLEKRKEEYRRLEKIYCPCLKDYVYFNSDGFIHLRHDAMGKPRNLNEQLYKLNLFPLVIPIIKIANRIDEYRIEEVKTSRKKKNSKIKKVEYWALVDLVGRKCPVKIKVILRRIGTGKITFRSVMKLTK